MAYWEDVHSGSIVLGHDGQEWGVVGVEPSPDGPVVTLRRHEQEITGRPPAGTDVQVLQDGGWFGERLAADIMLAAGLGPIEIVDVVERGS